MFVTEVLLLFSLIIKKLVISLFTCYFFVFYISYILSIFVDIACLDKTSVLFKLLV